MAVSPRLKQHMVSELAWSAARCGMPSQEALLATQQILEQAGLNAQAGRISQTASTMIEEAKKQFAYFKSHEALNSMRKAVNAVDGYAMQHTIVRAEGLVDLQQLGQKARNYLMSDPVIFNHWEKSRIDGYSGTDWVPHDTPLKHSPYYRELISGQYVQSETDPQVSVARTCYLTEDDLPQEMRLTPQEKRDIRYNIDLAKLYIELNGEDPTSDIGGWL